MQPLRWLLMGDYVDTLTPLPSGKLQIDELSIQPKLYMHEIRHNTHVHFTTLTLLQVV